MNPQTHQNLFEIRALIVGLLLGFFIKSLMFPGWESSLEVLGTLGFAGYLYWLNPMRKLEVKREDFEKLEDEVRSLKEQLTNIRIKFGFQRSA